MRKQSLAKNYFFQFGYQALVLVIPFIIAPYLTRTLGETSLGTYTFANSIAYYFIIVANLGIGVHGKRVISQQTGNETEQRRVFWSLFVLHAAISTIAIGCYFFFVFAFIHQNQNIYMIEGVYVASALFDITWLFYGLENFSTVVIKNTLVKIIECVCIFSFVKTPSDLPIYTAITASGMLLGQAIMIPQAIRILKPIRFTSSDVKKHIKPLLVFSVALIASSMYTVFDKTLLGLLSTVENVAFYEYANKIVYIPKMFVEIVSSVMFPRACQLAIQKRTQESAKLMDYSFVLTAFLGMGAAFGLSAIAKEFSTLYYGDAFSICGNIMISLSPLIYIIGAGKIIRSQYMIPYGMDKHFNLCIVYNAIINLLVSSVLIPLIGIYGAVIGTIVSELFGLFYQMFICRKNINYATMFKTALSFSVIGAVMVAVILLLPDFNYGTIWSLLYKIGIGGVTYLILSFGYIWFFYRNIVFDFLHRNKKD